MHANRSTGENASHPFGHFRLTGATRNPYSDAVDFSVLGPLHVEGLRGTIEIRGPRNVSFSPGLSPRADAW